jgi:hypothetical protein
VDGVTIRYHAAYASHIPHPVVLPVSKGQ